jgi:hypothetical protein
MPPQRVNAFREPLDAISRLLKQSGLFFVCGLMLKGGCQHARNCANADRWRLGRIADRNLRDNLKTFETRLVYRGVIPIASDISSCAWM